ncbi:MAG: TrkA family potassium uptake protein [Anaerolineae bacterium]
MKMIIVGCGRMGAGLAQVLNERGHTVVVIDKDSASFERLGKSFKGKTIEGVGFDRQALLDAGIERADGLSAVMASDEANVVTAQLARQVFHVPQVVARLYDPLQAEVYQRLGLQIISPATWGIQRIADLLCRSQRNVVMSLGGGEIDLMEVEIPPTMVAHQVNELTIPGEVSVMAITRRGKAFLPTLGTLLETGDVLYLAGMTMAKDRLRGLLGTRGSIATNCVRCGWGQEDRQYRSITS